MTWPHHIYLGSVTPDEGSKHEILEGSEPNNWAQSYPMRAPNLRYFRTAQTTAAMTRLKPVWNDRNISVSSKIRLMRSLVAPIFLYACESLAELQRRMPWKWGATARYYASRIEATLPTRKSVPRSSWQSNHTQTWPSQRDANLNGMDMSPAHQVWSKPSCKAQWNGEEDNADRKRGGKTTSGNGQAWSSSSSQRTVENSKKEWRKLVVKSPVVSHRPTRLRDRWRWRAVTKACKPIRCLF